MKYIKKTTMKRLFNTKDCWGWACKASNTSNKYMWQNDNDLGLICEDLNFPIYITKKVEIIKGKYLYLFSYGSNVGGDGTECTLATIKALIKECHKSFCELTNREKTLCKKYWGY